MTFSKVFVETVTTSSQKRGIDKITIKNPLDKETNVNGIEIVPKAEFSKKGKLIITINDTNVFDENVGDFSGYAKFPIQLNKTLRRTEKIVIEAWNGVDTNPIECSFNISISEIPQPFNSQAVPLAKDAFNQIVSESEVIFANQQYSDQTITGLISLIGYKKMILLIGSGGQTGRTVHQDDFAFASPEIAIDGDTSSLTDTSVNGATKDFIVDFGSVASRIPVCKLRLNNLIASDYDHELAVSDDDISYTTIDTQNDTIGGVDITLNAAEQSFRYMRMRSIYNSGPVNIIAVYEMYDGNLIGGTASISIEVLDESNNIWIELISASEIGSISTGNSISKQLGDVINDLASNKFNVSLPSTQTGLRAKMIIAGNLKVGVSIIKVS